MSSRKVTYKANQFIKPCPECGNNTSFTIKSDYCAEDCCEIWAVCVCGFDPSEEDTNSRLEDVWGGCDDNNCQDAITYVWNELITDKNN